MVECDFKTDFSKRVITSLHHVYLFLRDLYLKISVYLNPTCSTFLLGTSQLHIYLRYQRTPSKVSHL